MRTWKRGWTDSEGRVEVRPAREPIGLGRAMTLSVVVCTVVFLLGVGVPTWLLMGRLADGLGLGLFAAFWGGPGFGVMAGGAVYALSQERAAQAALVERRAPVVDEPAPKAVGVTASDAAGVLVAS
jgi:hypothetical protein